MTSEKRISEKRTSEIPRPVFVCHHAKRSGGELTVADLLPELIDLQPMVVTGDDGPMVDLWRQAGAEVEVVPYGGRAGARRDGPMAALATATDLVGWGRRLPRPVDGQVLVANSLPAGLAISLSAARRAPAGRRPVWAIHDHLDPAYLGSVAARAAGLALRRWPGPVVANAAATAATLPPGVSATVIHPATAPLERDHTTPGGSTVVAVVGRLAPWKGQDRAVEAFARAFAGGPQRLLLVGGALFGEDDYRRQVLDRCDQPDIRAQVTVVGHVDDVAGAVSSANVLVHSSVLAEPFGRVVVEGLSAGLAVVASDGPSTRHILDGGRLGVLVAPGSVDELAAALSKLDADREERDRLAAAGPPRAADFTPAAAAKAWRAVLSASRGAP